MLPNVLQTDETLNCLVTGVHDSNRKMIAVTDRRIYVLFVGALGAGDVKVFSRRAVMEYTFDKKFLRSSILLDTTEGCLVFTGVQGARKELFDWAMTLPIPE